MTLAIRITKLRCLGYIPRPEVMLEEYIPRGRYERGIWDILGAYHEAPMIITIHEREIQEETKKLSQKLADLGELKISLILRELVRLHEHAHALLHVASMAGIESEVNWFRRLPPEVNEPMTEAIVYSTIQNNVNKDVIKVFEAADERAPDYYRKWATIKEIGWLCSETLYLFVMHARTKVWNNWEDFATGLRDEESLRSLWKEKCEGTFLMSANEVFEHAIEEQRPRIEEQTIDKFAVSVIEELEKLQRQSLDGNLRAQQLQRLRKKVDGLWEIWNDFCSQHTPMNKIVVEDDLMIADDKLHQEEGKIKTS